MDETKNGGPAFPIVVPANDLNRSKWQPGMTLRDYFAAKVIASCIQEMPTLDEAAALAYQIADGMLKAREVAK